MSPSLLPIDRAWCARSETMPPYCTVVELSSVDLRGIPSLLITITPATFLLACFQWCLGSQERDH